MMGIVGGVIGSVALGELVDSLWPVMVIAIVVQTGFAYCLGLLAYRLECSGRLPSFPRIVEQTFPVVLNGYILFGLTQLVVGIVMGVTAALSGVWCACVGAGFAMGLRGTIWYSEHQAGN